MAKGIWTRLLAVLQLNLEDLNVLFCSSSTFEAIVLLVFIFTFKNCYHFILKTCAHNVQKFIFLAMAMASVGDDSVADETKTSDTKNVEVVETGKSKKKKKNNKSGRTVQEEEE